ncbi:MAG: hypothetical protein HN474_07980 [Nitrospina sp.]|nr:hypothetical protein [Nitrospina sp.]
MEDNSIKNGLSYKIKIPIIVLTLITLCVMGALFIKIAFSISSSEKMADSNQYFKNVGDKLKNKGLQEQAINQYIKYLGKTNIKNPTHAIVAHNIGELYLELSNCEEGLIWLFQAEEAGVAYHRANELKNHIDVCLAKINSLEPNNLNVK